MEISLKSHKEVPASASIAAGLYISSQPSANPASVSLIAFSTFRAPKQNLDLVFDLFMYS